MKFRIIAIMLSAVFMSVAQVLPAASEMSDSEKRDIERIVRDYILTNPEIIETALRALEEKRREEELQSQRDAIVELQDQIFNSKHQVVLGNPTGNVTMVEFFDYNCGYCRRAMSDMMALIESNPDLRVVLKEFPILSEGSLEAARVAVAVNKLAPEKYMDFHQEMFSRRGQADGAKALEIAADLGLDQSEVAAEADTDDVRENLTEVRTLARALGISGTPSYVVGNEAVFGAVGFDELQEKVIAARACETVVC